MTPLATSNAATHALSKRLNFSDLLISEITTLPLTTAPIRRSRQVIDRLSRIICGEIRLSLCSHTRSASAEAIGWIILHKSQAGHVSQDVHQQSDPIDYLSV
jgi:hypothetical protein